MRSHTHTLSRRSFVAKSTMLAASSMTVAHWTELTGFAANNETHQANGIKIGEVTDASAIIWTRLTASSVRNNQGVIFKGKVDPKQPREVDVALTELEGACPGAPGRVRVRYSTNRSLSRSRTIEWAEVSVESDFTHQFHLSGLKPETVYHFAVETTGPGGSPRHGAVRGSFQTAPRPNQPTDLTFCVVTCFGYHDLDHADGFNIYPAMAGLHPRFVAFTGDNVYYDNEEPSVKNAAMARYHWERMYSLPRHIDFLRQVATYWEKDDHDTLSNDCWPGMKWNDLTYSEGQRIFREQVPIGDQIYRTYRWGRDLQIWLTDGRDFRSPNTMPDGLDKTIWGKEQKEWLKRTLKESNATWKVLISPTPIVGPDARSKKDNHSNKAFQHEGDEIRAWFKANVPDNCFVLCGDRHWQYHSVHPQTGLNEFSVGAASDPHAGGTPGYTPEYHRFHRVKGGFLSVTVRHDDRRSAILFQHRDVFGNAVYEWKRESVVKR